MTLTNPEKLFLWRRRLGKTQPQMAKAHRLTPHAYIMAERGLTPMGPELTKTANQVRSYTPLEECVILRHRDKMTQQVLADELGLSRIWVVRMERGQENAQPLLEFWGGALVK